MNVLILTGKFGMGHMTAAKAVGQEILRAAPDAQITTVDIIEYCFPLLKNRIYGWFNFMVHRCAGIYNLLNKLAGRCGCSPLKRATARKIGKLLTECKADFVVSVLPLSSQYVSAYKELTGNSIPLYTYITDIGAHKEWIASNTDCYFVGAEDTKQQLLDAGVPANRIVVSGIPVRQEFKEKSAERPYENRDILVIGGGLGLIPHADRLFSLLANVPNLRATIITGKNRHLYNMLKRNYPSFRILGYTDHIQDYMRRSDLIITKAGGISTFEAIHMGVPLLIIHPFLMQEQENALYIERQGLGRVVWNKNDKIAQEILDILYTPNELARIKQHMNDTALRLETATPMDVFTARTVAI